MRKTQKQILGFAGLAAVGVMTATAYMIPAPNAAAEAGHGIYSEKADDDEDFKVQVTVTAGAPSATVVTPADGQEYNTNVVPVSIRYEMISKLVSTLQYTDEDGKLQEVTVDEYTPTGEAQDGGVRSFSINLSSYGSQNGQYKLTTRAYDLQGNPRQSDVVTFGYTSTVVTPQPKPEEGGNPTIDVDVNDDVDKVIIQIYDKDGKPILVDKDGNETPIIVNKDELKDGNVLVELPLEQYGVKEGEYTITIDSYDKNGKQLSAKVTQVDYKPATPEIPNTGNLIGDLNISRLDYIVTGLIAFGLIAGFAVYLVLRKSRR